jgi:hypothetical protein
MKSIKHLHLLEYLYSALTAEIGVIVRCEDRKYVLQKFYEIRKLEEPTFDELSFLQAPNSSTDLWILKRRLDGPTEAGPDEAYLIP